ncbi:MAG TPA: hypothetical protein IAA60_03135 [Candidatus Ornithomonoglobus intestinigallinarum]|uniref:Uncharacterized protein n=1 Tax=Candidatus Ornithomonoglobus intestinigallinarum TaxID=2840894 RepID=A0A9D1H281_9FIRM|nr:hypothetical protein [Candidatus Ornithomonoglobus intestinigallinarum]
MIRFYREVDLRSRTAMIEFLKNHFRYYTMNSWNRAQSYACNLKIYRLGLDKAVTDKLFDLLETQESYDAMHDLIEDFNLSHNYRWQAGMNGRSGGYLVLYQGESRPSEYKSYCTNCGQRNFSSVSETGAVCGRCRQAARIDYRTVPKDIFVYPGRGTDDDKDFADWDLDALKSRVKLVQEFDSLADSMVGQAVYFAKHYELCEEEYFVPQSRKVLKAL